MPQYIGMLQTVAPNANVQFMDTVCGGNKCITHRAGSGLVTLKGGQGRAIYKVDFGANVAIPEDGTVGPISLAISIDGEPVQIMTVTPAAVEEFFNVFGSTLVCAPCGCCVSVSVRNIGEEDITVTDASLIVERRA